MKPILILNACAFFSALTLCPPSFATETGTHGGDPDAAEFVNYAKQVCLILEQHVDIPSFDTDSCKKKARQLEFSLSSGETPLVSVVETILKERGVDKVALYDATKGSVELSRPLWTALTKVKKMETAAIEMAGLTGFRERYVVGEAFEEVVNHWAQHNTINKTPRLVAGYYFTAGDNDQWGMACPLEIEVSGNDVIARTLSYGDFMQGDGFWGSFSVIELPDGEKLRNVPGHCGNDGDIMTLTYQLDGTIEWTSDPYQGKVAFESWRVLEDGNLIVSNYLKDSTGSHLRHQVKYFKMTLPVHTKN